MCRFLSLFHPMTMKRSRLALLSLVGCCCYAFQPPVVLRTSRSRSVVLQRRHNHDSVGDDATNKTPLLERILDTTTSVSNKDSIQLSGLFGPVKKVHNPITYFVLGLAAGFRWDWCFRSPLYWFAIAFTVKWYRARYVFKIPVWDRQPNWNNVITSKEQEKDLKALTCKSCGSTIFIAKSREFFFEGTTGIGGLGCYACGAKGKDNFVMDRDRILEDVGDMDDYFEYETPLDLVSRAERRKVMKEAQGDEEKANKLLLERGGVVDAEIVETPAEPSVNGDATTGMGDSLVEDAVIENEVSAAVKPKKKKKKKKKAVATTDASDASASSAIPTTSKPKKKKKGEIKDSAVSASIEDQGEVKSSTRSLKKKKLSQPQTKSKVELDDLDVLDMDAW